MREKETGDQERRGNEGTGSKKRPGTGEEGDGKK